MGCRSCGKAKRIIQQAIQAKSKAMSSQSSEVVKWRGTRGQPIGKISRDNKVNGNE